MKLHQAFEPFIQQRPICVMARAILERMWSGPRIDDLFTQTAQTQYARDLAFSQVVDLMGQVVLNRQPSVHAAYQAQQETLPVSAKALYDKLNGVEPQVSAALVADSAQAALPVIRALGGGEAPYLHDYRTKVADGNHFSATEHRLKELRTTSAAPLPGKVLAVLDQESGLIEHVVPEEDGQAQERSRLPELLQQVRRDELWIADRNFCTIRFLLGIAGRRAAFLIRQHGQLKGAPLGPRQSKGRCATGAVWEQKLKITDPEAGAELVVRRITVELDEPTRDGDAELHLLTNVPARQAAARKLANLYRKRWTIETAFQRLTETLTCEIRTLAYPKAALFAFCLALAAYNAVVVLQAALAAAHGREQVSQNVSGYYLSLEITQAYDGLMVAVPAAHWTAFRNLSAAAFARWLTEVAGYARLSRYQKHPRGPKKKPPTRTPYQNGAHVSTAKLMAQRKPNN